MAAARATSRCPVCKKGSRAAGGHPSCLKRRRQGRRRMMANPRREVKRRVKAKKRAVKKRAKGWARNQFRVHRTRVNKPPSLRPRVGLRGVSIRV